MSVPKGVSNNESSSIGAFVTQYQANNDLFDDVLENAMDYDLYGKDKRNKEHSNFKDVFDQDINNIRQQHLGILNESVNYHNKVTNAVDEQNENLNKSYNYVSDMHRNQKFMNGYVKESKDKLEDRNFHLLQGLENNKKQTEIYTYYYKKNKAQLKLLYSLMFVILIIISLSFLNMKFSYIMNDTLYVILIGILTSGYVIYLCYMLYDIFMRDNVNFDEYGNGMWTKEQVNPEKALYNSTENKEFDFDSQCFQDLSEKYL
jgi:hypothetical protein